MNMSTWQATLTLPVFPARDHIRGPANAPLMLVEYGDYECPHCAAAHPIVDAIQLRFGDELGFVFRHFPLTTVHPHAEQAAEAAEGAGAQGKFWAMHDILFKNQQQLADPYLLAYARTLDLDVSLLAADLDQHTHSRKVREDFISGARSGVNGTPTFYINGVRHDGSWDFAALMAALQEAAMEELRA
jgi:protein-disulfide isomerase